jgi:secondary thiamine-phosphate synthase enzyme
MLASNTGGHAMRIAQDRLTFDTAPREIKEITRELAAWTASQGMSRGLLSVFIRHTSASLLIQENYSPDVLRDLAAFLGRLAPEDPSRYRHNDEGPDDMPAHLPAGAPRAAAPPRADPDPDRRVSRQPANGRRPECF